MPKYTEKPVLSALRVNLLPETKGEFINWQARLNALIAAFPGFISLEFLSPSEQHPNWLIVQRFSNNAAAVSWHQSEQYKQLLNELQNLATEDGIKESTTDESDLREGVTEMFITEISPEREQEYRLWTAKIHQVEAKFPGFRGVYVQSPKESGGRHWITLLQFDTMKNLDQWLDSSERKELLKESNSLISFIESHRVISPYAGWFASIAKVGEVPPAWKQAMVVLLVIFPIVMLELKFLSPHTQALDMSLATFIANAISVTLLTFPFMPIAIWFLKWWLSPQQQNYIWISILGTIVVCFLYLLEIFLFWHLV